MTNSWTNADGEPIMDGAAWRFEQELDAYYDEYDRPERWEQDDWEDCNGNCSMGDANLGNDGVWTCAFCGTPVDADDEDYEDTDTDDVAQAIYEDGMAALDQMQADMGYEPSGWQDSY